jgi:hypothetical protein
MILQTSPAAFYYAIKRDKYHEFEKIAQIIFDYLGSLYLMGKIRSVLQSDTPLMRKAIKSDPQTNLNKLGCTFFTDYFTGHIDMIVIRH